MARAESLHDRCRFHGYCLSGDGHGRYSAMAALLPRETAVVEVHLPVRLPILGHLADRIIRPVPRSQNLGREAEVGVHYLSQT